MKNKILAIMMGIMLSVSLVGCGSNERIIDESESHRFQSIWLVNSDYIFVDKETGVQYLFVENGYGAGLTVLVDADEKPILYEGEFK